MKTFSEVINKYDISQKEIKPKSSVEELNERFQRYWTSLFKDKKITDKWINKEPDEAKLLISILEDRRKYYLVIKNTSINKVEILGLHDEVTPKYITSNLSEVYEQILHKLLALKLEKDFKGIVEDSLLAKYLQFQHLDFCHITDVMKYVLGDKLVIENGNSIIINQKEIDCIDLLFFKEYYNFNKVISPINLLFKQNNKETSLKLFEILQKHDKYKELLPTILNNLAETYWSEIEKHFSEEQFDIIKEKFEQFRSKHQIDKHWGLTFYNKDNDLSWKLEAISHEDYTYHPLENNYQFLRYIKNLSKEDFNKIINCMEKDLLRFLASYTIHVIGKGIYYDASLNILLLNKIKKNFKETFTFKGEDITISKSSDYFIMTYKDYQCVYSFLDDRVFSFSNPTLNSYNIECFKDFEKEVNKDVDFLIEFLNS